MIQSMTGFGKATGEYKGDTITVELSAVNHRYLDASVRLPGEWSSLDPALRETLKERLSRGKINVSISRKRANGAAARLKLDRDLAGQYLDIARELGELTGSGETLSLQTLAQFERLYTVEEVQDDIEDARETLSALLAEALDRLSEMRASEGETLAGDLLARLEAIRDCLAAVEARLPLLNELYAERLRTRIRDLGQDGAMPEDRLALEVALSAERGDVTEEVVRLKSHLDHAEELLRANEPAGRKLNFLAQEMQREINTLGSKVRDTDVVRQVLEMKSELERIREQIQNVE